MLWAWPWEAVGDHGHGLYPRCSLITENWEETWWSQTRSPSNSILRPHHSLQSGPSSALPPLCPESRVLTGLQLGEGRYSLGRPGRTNSHLHLLPRSVCTFSQKVSGFVSDTFYPPGVQTLEGVSRQGPSPKAVGREDSFRPPPLCLHSRSQ